MGGRWVGGGWGREGRVGRDEAHVDESGLRVDLVVDSVRPRLPRQHRSCKRHDTAVTLTVVVMAFKSRLSTQPRARSSKRREWNTTRRNAIERTCPVASGMRSVVPQRHGAHTESSQQRIQLTPSGSDHGRVQRSPR